MNFDLTQLQDDGDETATGGFTLRLSIERTDGRDGERPAHFTGAARKLHPSGYRNGYDAYWWQPPTGDYAPTDVQEFARYVTEVIADGYAYVSLTLTAPDGSAYTEGIGGISPAYPDAETLSYFLPDLYAETEAQFYESAAAALHTSADILTY